MELLERFASLPFTDGACSEYSNLLSRQSYRKKFRRLSRTKEKVGQNVEKKVFRVPETEDEEGRNKSGAASPSKRQRQEKEGEYLVQDGICL